ncbi:hypothetical protein [Gordonia sp. (in: high G+C Gram-positive bacteria)]|uniref:hypothetical protein n=1 Tax=Gordonia sp. (in: high G+C Gram-positive bacteria) TaxID=84139 RepID=UPI002601B393|nr:hypothetical protein [Gordonia sp. (in: high G+C Gram-positive bacteria)]
MAPIDRAALNLGDELGKGGQGAVLRTGSALFGRDMVYKAYKPGPLADLDVDALHAMVATMAGIDDVQRDRRLDVFAWPCALVADSGAVTGFLMPAVPAEFTSPSPRGADRKPILNEFQHLLNSPQFLGTLGFAISRRTQIDLLISVATAMAVLHKGGYTIGDFSPKNILFDPATSAVYFLDCDAMVHRGRSALPQAETPSWNVPAGEQVGTPEGDAYKLGLLVLRLFAGDQHTRDADDLPADLEVLKPLLVRALTTTVADRPTPGVWVSLLRDLRPQADPAPLMSAGLPAPASTIGLRQTPSRPQSASRTTPVQTPLGAPVSAPPAPSPAAPSAAAYQPPPSQPPIPALLRYTLGMDRVEAADYWRRARITAERRGTGWAIAAVPAIWAGGAFAFSAQDMTGPGHQLSAPVGLFRTIGVVLLLVGVYAIRSWWTNRKARVYLTTAQATLSSVLAPAAVIDAVLDVVQIHGERRTIVSVRVADPYLDLAEYQDWEQRITAAYHRKSTSLPALGAVFIYPTDQ